MPQRMYGRQESHRSCISGRVALLSSEMPICIGEIKLMRPISRATPCGSGAHISSDDASGMLNAAAIAIKSSAPLPLVGIGQRIHGSRGSKPPSGVVSHWAAFVQASVAGCIRAIGPPSPKLLWRAAFAQASVAWLRWRRPARLATDPALGGSPSASACGRAGRPGWLAAGPHVLVRGRGPGPLAVWSPPQSKHFARTNRSRPR